VAPVLRRHILRAGEIGSLLHTLRSGGETIFKLAGQQCLWVDADALLSLVSRAMWAECQGQNPLPLLEEAYALARGEFLEDDLNLKDERVGLAEELLFSALEEEQAEPAVHTRELARRIQQGLILRERRGRYTAVQAHIPSLAGLHRASTEQANSFDVE
jgi:hypothetical protein